jgi:membrane peptidoglycan carboxypeptidase
MLAVLLAALALLVVGVVYLESLPGVGDAEARVRTILLAHHGVRSGLPPPARLAAAVVAVEDQHFYSNFAVNILDGAGRAALAALHTSGDPGGSTIAQQLAKQLYGKGSGLGSTLREIGLAVKLSLSYSKPMIMSMYLNAIYYGNGYWGDEQAAYGYFHTSPYRLDWAEAAMLAGLPQAPSAYDPIDHFALAKQRQQHVLEQLAATHMLTVEQANSVYHEVLPLR